MAADAPISRLPLEWIPLVAPLLPVACWLTTPEYICCFKRLFWFRVRGYDVVVGFAASAD